MHIFFITKYVILFLFYFKICFIIIVNNFNNRKSYKREWSRSRMNYVEKSIFFLAYVTLMIRNCGIRVFHTLVQTRKCVVITYIRICVSI